MPRSILSLFARKATGTPKLRWQGPAPDLAAWYSDKDFTTDWLTRDLDSWLAALDQFKGRPAKVLDIGSYEGRSAVTFLEMLPNAHVVSMDQFAFADKELAVAVEARFDKNMEGYGERIRKIKGPAAATLDDLRKQKEAFDVIYADAGKARDWVFALSALAWPLLKVGGVIIWDDLKWGRDKPSAERPGDAILLFAEAFAPSLEVLHNDRQLIARKTSEWPNL